MTLERLHAEVTSLRAREREMVELLGLSSSDRLLHEFRNVLNELQLLRVLASETSDADDTPR